jgi:pimeloyl-ACP methyl ester carboxylesterase
MALEYAKKYPTNVTHLVLMCTAPSFSDAARDKAEQYLEESVCPERKTVLAVNLSSYRLKAGSTIIMMQKTFGKASKST